MNTFTILYDLTKEYAEKWGLDFIETTTGQNGFPRHLRPGLKGFESVEQMEAAKISILAEARQGIEAARKAGEVDEDEARRQSDSLKASYIAAWQRDGWSLWNYTTSNPDPYTLEDRDLVDITPSVDRDDEMGYTAATLSDLTEAGALDPGEVEERIRWARAIWDEYQSAGEGEAVAVSSDRYGDPDGVTREPRKVWEFSEDSKCYAKAVMFDTSL